MYIINGTKIDYKTIYYYVMQYLFPVKYQKMKQMRQTLWYIRDLNKNLLNDINQILIFLSVSCFNISSIIHFAV